jgi:sigma-B regulation protein RsbU (phosphoserine phosphatase)
VAAAELKLIRLSAIQAVFLVSAVGLLIAGYLLTQRTIVNPISALEAATRRMAGGDLVSPIEVEPAASGEIGALARSFEGMREELARLHQEEIERERLEQELAVARQIQLTMLPKGCPVLPGWECAVFYQAARQVGGDFYDFFELPGEPKRMGIVIADVADKGVPAALSMALGRTVIRNAAAGGRSPSAALTLANELILKDTQAGLFVTAVYAALDARSGRLAYAIAGHNRPLWLQVGTGEIQELTAQGIVLGILEDIELEEREICVVPGDFLVFYTDGVTEAMDAHGQTFGEERLQAAVATNLDASAQQILSTVLDAVKTFTGDAPQSDDLALLVVRRCP